MNISKRRLVGFALPVLVGVLVGNIGGRGGGSLIPAEGIAISLAGFILLILAFIALLLVKQPDGNGGPAARTTLLVAGLFVAGFGGEWLRSAALRPPPPVRLEASGTVRLSLDGLTGYTPRENAPARCFSDFDSEAIQSIEPNTAGMIGADTVHMTLSMSPRDHPGIPPFVTVRIAPAVEGPGRAPSWGGSIEFAELDAGGRSGRMTFARLTLDGDASGGQPAGWPIELSGSLTWSCGEWTE